MRKKAFSLVCVVVLLSGCANTTVQRDKTGVKVAAEGSVLLYDVEDMIQAAESAYAHACGGAAMDMANIQNQSGSQTLLASLSDTIKTVKGIFDLFPKHKFDLAMKCPGDVDSGQPSVGQPPVRKE